jgi:hypothetical protein
MKQADTQNENPTLKKTVESNNSLKNLLVEHVGNKLAPEDNNVTMEMVVEVMADEFPEFVMVLAEENWIRGYQQGLDDVYDGKNLMEEENGKKRSCKLCED